MLSARIRQSCPCAGLEVLVVHSRSSADSKGVGSLRADAEVYPSVGGSVAVCFSVAAPLGFSRAAATTGVDAPSRASIFKIYHNIIIPAIMALHRWYSVQPKTPTLHVMVVGSAGMLGEIAQIRACLVGAADAEVSAADAEVSMVDADS